MPGNMAHARSADGNKRQGRPATLESLQRQAYIMEWIRSNTRGLGEALRFEGENMFILWWIVVGLIAGWITGKIMKGGGYGTIWDIVLGIAGAIVGGWIMRLLGGTGQGGMIYTIIVAIGGAVLLTLLVRLITGNRTKGSGSGGLRRAA